MKKISAVLLTLFAFAASTVFADDAQVLPKGVFRITTALSYASGSQVFDKDGKAQDMPNSIDSISALNLGLALEYGVNDWISAAFQWAPGYTLTSNAKGFTQPTPYPGVTFEPSANVNGVYDIFAGAKVQIVGDKAPVTSEKVRFAAAAGIKIPMPAPDWEKQMENLMAEKDTTISTADKHAWGLGGRLYADYVINEMFFVNAYSEFIYYFERKDALDGPGAASDKADIAYGYDLTLELEPHFNYMLSEGLSLGAGLPLTYSVSPDTEYNGEAQKDSGSTTLQIGPNISCFFMKTVVPFELKLAYMTPLMGTNTYKLNTISLQGKVYLKF